MSSSKRTQDGSTNNSGSLFTVGPRKKRKGPSVRLSNHKARSVWFQSRSSWPVREAPVKTLVRERTRVQKALADAPDIPAVWECIGPTNVGGRVTCIVCHPAHAERIWIGAAGGGVWQSSDSGQTWQSFWNDQDILNIGSLAIDPRNPDKIYCGTGEANLSLDSYPGVGLYYSTDAGQIWTLLASTERTGIPRHIGVIAIDPFDSRHILLGGVGYAEVSQTGNDYGGMYVSRDSGVSWRRETFISEKNYWCHSIVFHPTRKNILFATFTEQGARSGIWKSTNGGKTWTHLLSGLPEPARFGRTLLAISKSDPDILFAFANDEASGNKDLLLGVFRTGNGGDRWRDMSGTHFKDEGQISYGNTIVIHPTDPNHVICGGVDLHLTRNGGKTWRQITEWDRYKGDPKYAHADHHALLMPSTVTGRVYDCNDGGLDVSENGGLKWTNRSNGLAITMFYDMDVAQSNALVYGGGAQDNGTVITETGSSSNFYELLGGDGGWIVFDPNDATRAYASYYNLHIYRFRGEEAKNVTPHTTAEEKNSVWMAYITLDPSDSRTIFTGSYRMWRTRNDANNWTPVSPTLDGSSISAIEVAPANPKRVYVGTENGGFFRSLDGGETWSPNLSSSVLPGHTITRLETHPTNAQLIYATVANFSHSHVFRSKDSGVTWEDVDRGQLPDVPHHALLIPNDQPSRLYVGNDAGVFVLNTETGLWNNLTKNLPNAMAVDLVYHAGDRSLHVATYGRSIWKLKL
ncbi:MAG: WD40/YVTN/BNR-like repeat-containing protein [Pyrinomonadaceae bacterium]